MLSGGERKRVALASVLAWKPKAVVMDEPTIGQDHDQKEKLRQFIVQLNTQGTTVVVVTHDVEFVAECGPRVLLMADGRVVADGPSKDVLTNPHYSAQASIVLPQITQLFRALVDFGLPTDVIDLYEARRKLLETVGGK
jgi:energy-coupling factor transport system ATP-binding protein